MKKEILMKRFGFCLMVLIIVVAFMVGFAGQVQAEKPQYGGVLKVISPRGPRDLGWPSGSGGPGLVFRLPCIEGLVRMGNKGLPSPFLATSWKYADDLSSLTFTLRKGVKFHDGIDFNAEAAKINLEERIENGLMAYQLRIIESIDIIDEHTIRLNLREFKNDLLESLTSWNGLVISPKVIEKAKTKKGKTWAKKNPVGTGPFKFVSFERDVMLKYERFDGYWQKGRPYLDGIEMHFIKDPMVQAASLRAGEGHVLMEARNKYAFELKQEGFRVVDLPVGIRSLATDAANLESIFADKRVREAIEYAIDRKSLTGALGYGFWYPVNQYSPSRSNSHIPNFVGRPYNTDKAKQLLAEAGYPNGLKARLICNTVEAERDTVAAIQRYLRNVGIDVKVEYVDPGKYWYYMIKGWKNGIIHVGQLTEVIFTAQLSALFKTGAARLPHILRSPELDAVIKKAQSAFDYKIQKALTQKVVRMIHDNVVMSPLWEYSRLTVMYNNVHDAGFDEGNGRIWTPDKAWLSK